MAKHVLRNLDLTEHDLAEQERNVMLRPGGRAVVTQACIHAFLAAQDEADRLAAMLRKALMDGSDVEEGDLAAGLYIEMERRVNWRAELVRVAGEDAARAVNAATPRTPTAPRLRVGEAGAKQKGERVAPTVDGSPVLAVKVDVAAAEAA